MAENVEGKISNPIAMEVDKLDDISKYFRIKSHIHVKDLYYD